MTVFEYHHAGNSEAQQKAAVAYLLAQSSVGKAATGVLSGLAVAQTSTASGSVTVAAGAGVAQSAVIDGASVLVNDTQVTLDVLGPNPVGGLPRNDMVVLDRATSSVRAIIGTPNAVPTDPTVPASAVPLARLRHAASATTIPSSKIDDLRTFTHLFGVGDDTGIMTSGFTAATGWSIATQQWLVKNGVVQIYLRFTRTGSTITPPSDTNLANVLVATAPASCVPPIPVGGSNVADGPVSAFSLWSDGQLSLCASAGTIASGSSVSVSFTFPKA